MDTKRDDLKARRQAYLKKKNRVPLEILRDGPDGDKQYRVNGVRKMTPRELEKLIEFNKQQSRLAYGKALTKEEREAQLDQYKMPDTYETLCSSCGALVIFP